MLVRRIFNKLGIYKTYPLNVNDVVFKVPIHKGVGFANFVKNEPWMTDLLAALGPNNTRFLDVGVNIGQTLLKWKSLFPNSPYTGFEPNPNCIDYLKRLDKENDLNCEFYPFALSTFEEKGKLYLTNRDKSDSSASIIQDFRKHEGESLSIQTTSLKKLGLSEFDLVKIDVEGAEAQVIETLFEVCTDAIIICEVLPVYSKENTERLTRQNELEAQLKKHDYLIYRVIKTEPVKLQLIDEIGINTEVALSDYVFLPRHKKDKFDLFAD